MFKLVLLLLPALVLVLAEKEQADPKEVAEDFFNGIDTDMDGIITIGDVMGYFGTNYDTDDDLEITKHEFKLYLAAQRPDLLPYFEVAFKMFDQNADGKLDNDDFTPAFLAADLNDNDLVDETEFLGLFVPIFEGIQNGAA